MSTPTSPTARSMWRSGRLAVIIFLFLLVAATIGAMLGPGESDGRHLDPNNAAPSGSKALAQLLRQRGITVDRVDSVEAAVAKGAERRLLLVTDTDYFDYQQLGRLAGLQGDRVIVGDLPGLSTLAPGVRTLSGLASERSREPSCQLPAARAAGSAYIGGSVFGGGTGCYPAGDGHALVQADLSGGTATVLGSGEFLTNRRLAEDGNAALALNLLGTEKAVTWLVRAPQPPVGDYAGPEGKTLGQLVPAGIPWALFMGGLAVVVTAFWQGRRLGPVVTERLPVAVRAAETVEGRGRLYRARRARERAAAALRAGALDRLTPRLGLASGAGSHEVVAALAVRTGQDPQHVGGALYGPPPADDAGLVALAGYLDHIERTISEH
ncbi:DUF4350 domain-containing protein [Nonomuraea sp. NBC_01738]|uniref:DUF4350 domain-containing protein n=1 Tax=Nonomuraea sp. NBC_01738 TaxID=2976003 RepID=UPI002E10BCEE|nr:DUF4350 domain-containing protein [Nonomuraea sp. NBC_01738]